MRGKRSKRDHTALSRHKLFLDYECPICFLLGKQGGKAEPCLVKRLDDNLQTSLSYHVKHNVLKLYRIPQVCIKITIVAHEGRRHHLFSHLLTNLPQYLIYSHLRSTFLTVTISQEIHTTQSPMGVIPW